MADRHAVLDLADMFDLIARELVKDALANENPACGYNIPPYGIGSLFGYHGPSAAWILLHPQGPALISRENDESLDPYIQLWTDHWLSVENPRHTWPTVNVINDAFLVPELEMPAGPPAMMKYYSRHTQPRRKQRV